jgi:hypothetical protein
MEREPKPRKTLAQYRQDALGVDDIVERHDRIVSEPDKEALSSKARLHLGLEPFVQHIVQENVREAGREHSLNAKDNFRFERTITGWRDGRVVDLRRKG